MRAIPHELYRKIMTVRAVKSRDSIYIVNNECKNNATFDSFWLWWWLPLWLSKCESPLPTTVLLRTTLTRTIKLHYYMLTSGSNHLLYNKICGSIAWLSRIVLFRFNENKVYQLRVGNLSFPVYCHLSGTDLGPYGAGGWTLVMKIDGSKVMWLTLKFVIERVVSS